MPKVIAHRASAAYKARFLSVELNAHKALMSQCLGRKHINTEKALRTYVLREYPTYLLTYLLLFYVALRTLRKLTGGYIK